MKNNNEGIKKVKKYESKLKNLGIKNINKAVDDLFDHIGYTARLLFWYWHFKEMERKLKGGEGK